MKRLALGTLSLLMMGCSVAAPPAQPTQTQTPPASQQPAASGAPTVVTVPNPEEICHKPNGDKSGLTVEVYKGFSDSTYRLQPGWTVPIPNWFFNAAVKYPEVVDRSTVKVTVEPSSWQYLGPLENEPPVRSQYFTFSVAPDGNRENRNGATGFITVIVEGAKSLTGKPLQAGPVQFRLYAYTPLMPGESMAACPGIEVAPEGGH
jgi:hypothetical protein